MDHDTVLSSGEGWDDHCITWLAWRPGTELSGVREAVHKRLWPLSSTSIFSTAFMDSLGLWEHGQVTRMDTKRTHSCCACNGPLPKFEMMNTVNVLTGFSEFQLQMGRFPHLILLIVPGQLPKEVADVGSTERAATLLEQIQLDSKEAKDNLILAKMTQAHHASRPGPHCPHCPLLLLLLGPPTLQAPW
jgi:hypothetical protein